MGFVFLSSAEKNTYSLLHVGFFEQIAAQLTVSVEKGRLYNELAEHKEAVERQNAAMTRDLEMARSVQQALIPHGGIEIPGLDIAFRYEPAIQVGGDMLDILPLDDQKVLLFVGDATGHGVHAALIMCAVRMAVHTAVKSDPSSGGRAYQRERSPSCTSAWRALSRPRAVSLILRDSMPM